MIARKGPVFSTVALGLGFGLAGFAVATGDDETKLHKAMEQVQAKNAYIIKNLKTPAVFKKNQKEIVEAAKALATLGKSVREETEPAKENKKDQALWTSLMDSFTKESETFAEAAGKDKAEQKDVKDKFKTVTATCTACHKDFRPDE